MGLLIVLDAHYGGPVGKAHLEPLLSDGEMAVAAGAAWYREIQIHEDLGHVCRVCGMIVREGLTQSLIISGERYVICLRCVMMLLYL